MNKKQKDNKEKLDNKNGEGKMPKNKTDLHIKVYEVKTQNGDFLAITEFDLGSSNFKVIDRNGYDVSKSIKKKFDELGLRITWCPTYEELAYQERGVMRADELNQHRRRMKRNHNISSQLEKLDWQVEKGEEAWK